MAYKQNGWSAFTAKDDDKNKGKQHGPINIQNNNNFSSYNNFNN